MAGVRTSVLLAVGGSWPVTLWAKWKCRGTCSVRRVGSALELRKGDRAVLLAAKHSFFAPRVCGAFEAFASAIPQGDAGGGCKTADFEANLDAFNISLRCLPYGVWIEHRGDEVWLRKDEVGIILSPSHVIYAPHLARHFDNYFTALVSTEKEGIQVLDCSRPGVLQTYRSSGLQFEMASLPEEGDAIDDYFRWYTLKPGDLVFDIGAHCGVSTYQFSRLVGDAGTVVCFEPDPVNFEILKRNIERHELKNVKVEKVAIAGERGELQFSAENSVTSMLSSYLTRETAGKMVTVEAWTLKDAFAKYGIPNLCKIDIEGAETDVIRQSAELLKKHKTNFTIDTNHPKANGEMTSADIEVMFRQYGYDVLTEAKPFFTTWARPK
jgi:FkbM family methyltransferase